MVHPVVFGLMIGSLVAYIVSACLVILNTSQWKASPLTKKLRNGPKAALTTLLVALWSSMALIDVMFVAARPLPGGWVVLVLVNGFAAALGLPLYRLLRGQTNGPKTARVCAAMITAVYGKYDKPRQLVMSWSASRHYIEIKGPDGEWHTIVLKKGQSPYKVWRLLLERSRGTEQREWQFSRIRSRSVESVVCMPVEDKSGFTVIFYG